MFYKKIKYPDGSFYVTVQEFVKEFTFRINSYQDLWELHQLVDAIWNKYKQVPIIIIPNLIDAQADKRFDENESFNLKLVLNFLSKMNACFKIFHPHNSEIVSGLMNNVEIIHNKIFIKEVFKNLPVILPNKYLDDNLILMSTDAGGFKPLMKLCDKINWQGETFSASKSRQYVDGKSKLTQQIDKDDFGGKDILIIDDICVNGGTFIGLAKMLKERNCGKLYLAISHLTVQHPNPELFELFDIVFTTNSKNLNYQIPRNNNTMNTKFPENLEIINLF